MNDQSTSKKLLDIKSGGWVILAAVIFSVAYFTIFIVNAINNQQHRIGDGRNLDTYQFSLSNPMIPVDQITPAGMSKDGLPSLSNPNVMTPHEVEVLNEDERGKYLVGRDIVVGLAINGETRAYPLRVLNWHEVINDTLGDIAIAIAYNPLSGSVVCFERTINEQIMEFGISGLLYNSHHLLYNREEEATESLWLPLKQKAVVGPLSGTELSLIPCTLSLWSEWIKKHPETTVVKPEYEYKKRYKRAPYSKYFEDPTLRFPVDPLPDDTLLPNKTMMIVIQGVEDYPFSYPEIAKQVDPNGIWETTIDNEFVKFIYYENPDVVEVELIEGSRLSTYYTFWFAWHAMNQT